MNKRKNDKKRKISFLGSVVVIFIIYLLFQLFFLQSELEKMDTDLAEINANIETQVIENEALKHLLENNNEKEYIEKIAREKFDYAYPDEQIYFDRNVE